MSTSHEPPTPPPLPPPAPRASRQRPNLGGSMAGHTALVGGSATTYLGSSFGATGLLVGAGVAGGATALAVGARKLGLRRPGSKRSGLGRGTGLTSRGLGLSRKGGGTGTTSRSRSGGLSGGTGARGKGLLGSARSRRNSTRSGSGSGSGLPGSGRTRAAGVLNRSAGGTGARGKGLSRSNRTTGAGTRPGSKRPGGGSRLPGATGARGKGLLGRRPGGGSSGGTGARGKGLSRRHRGSSPNGNNSRWKGFKDRFGSNRKRHDKKGNIRRNLFGKSKEAYAKAKYHLGSDRDRDLARRTNWGSIEHGPARQPLPEPKKTPTINDSKGENMSRFAKKPKSSSPFSSTETGPSSAGHGRISQAAEQFAQAIKNPGIDTKLLANVPRNFNDLANAQKIYAEAFKTMIDNYQEEHPDDQATVEKAMGQYRQLMNVADAMDGITPQHRRANAADYERIEAPRKDEEGRDYGANKGLV